VTVVFYHLWTRQPSSIKIENEESGFIEISRRALLHMVRNVCQELNLASKPKIKLRTENKALKLQIFIVIPRTGQLKNLSKLLQQKLDYYLRHYLGISSIASIDVSILGVKQSNSLVNRDALLDLPEETSASDEKLTNIELFKKPAEVNLKSPHSSTQSQHQ